MAKGFKSGGRVAGTPNKANAEIKALAAEHAPAVIVELARLALKAKAEAVRVAAGEALLNRGYGRPVQALAGADGESPLFPEIRMVPVNVGK